MAYRVFIQTDDLGDIQDAIDYYDDQKKGLGRKFEKALHKHFLILEKTPYFAIRYNNVHC